MISAAPTPVLSLQCLDGSLDWPCEVDEFPVVIGRGIGADVKAPDFFADECHCILRTNDDGYTLRDNDSEFGTWVNGKRISGDIRLQTGDRLAVGLAVFEFNG